MKKLNGIWSVKVYKALAFENELKALGHKAQDFEHLIIGANYELITYIWDTREVTFMSGENEYLKIANPISKFNYVKDSREVLKDPNNLLLESARRLVLVDHKNSPLSFKMYAKPTGLAKIGHKMSGEIMHKGVFAGSMASNHLSIVHDNLNRYNVKPKVNGEVIYNLDDRIDWLYMNADKLIKVMSEAKVPEKGQSFVINHTREF